MFNLWIHHYILNLLKANRYFKKYLTAEYLKPSFCKNKEEKIQYILFISTWHSKLINSDTKKAFYDYCDELIWPEHLNWMSTSWKAISGHLIIDSSWWELFLGRSEKEAMFGSVSKNQHDLMPSKCAFSILSRNF